MEELELSYETQGKENSPTFLPIDLLRIRTPLNFATLIGGNAFICFQWTYLSCLEDCGLLFNRPCSTIWKISKEWITSDCRFTLSNFWSNICFRLPLYSKDIPYVNIIGLLYLPQFWTRLPSYCIPRIFLSILELRIRYMNFFC